jgi:hypothetical protein
MHYKITGFFSPNAGLTHAENLDRYFIDSAGFITLLVSKVTEAPDFVLDLIDTGFI